MVGRPREDRNSDLLEKLVHVRRVAKVVKGGRRFGFSALVVVGDGKGRVGYGQGKASEVPEAIRKASEQAKRNLVRVALKVKDGNRTIHHDARAKAGSGKVTFRTAPPGTGIIAGGAIRAVCECLGIQDIVAKSTGSSNPFNMIRAAFSAFEAIESPKAIAQRRGMKVSEVVARRESVRGKQKVKSEA